jgi:hypothetical protein
MDHNHDDHRASDVHAAIILVLVIIAYALLWNAGASRFSGVGSNTGSRFEHTVPGPNMLPPF